jgi:hypothetical protein
MRMTRTEHQHPDSGPVALLITGNAAEVKIVADPSTSRARAEAEDGDDVKFESRADLLTITAPSGDSSSTTVIQHGGGKFNITTAGNDDLIIQSGGSQSFSLVEGGKAVMVGRGSRITVGSARPKITVYVPPLSSLDADIKSGNIITRGLLSGLGAHTASGNVRIDQVSGKADVGTGSGNVAIACAHVAVVRTGNGSIEIEEVTGRAQLRTGSGHITVASTAANCSVQATSGSGNITSRGRGIDLDASTGSGRVRQWS